MSRSPTSGRRDRAEAVIARELSALAETNAGSLPRGYANRVAGTLRAEGIGIRRQDALRLIREYADFLQLPGVVMQRQPERFGPARSAPAQARKQGAALDVVARMRRQGLSLARAVQAHNREQPESRISEDSVKRLVPRALEKRGTRWQATRYDRYARTNDAITTQGVIRVTVRDSRTASLIARHAAAVTAYLNDDADASVLRRFRGKSFRVEKRAYVLETNPEILKERGLGGEFDDLIVGSGQEMST